MKRVAIIVVSIICSNAGGTQCLFYPVAQRANGTVLLLYQQDSFHTKLFSWVPETGIAEPELASRHCPVGITVIPGSNAYSFIDNGRIRIKHPTKRSSRALDSDVPLYDIGPLSWMSHKHYGTRGFFSAKEQENHAIYATDLMGHVTRVVGTPGIDYMYPSCTDTGLFYITRRVDDTQVPRCKKHAQCRCRPINPVDVFIYSIHVISLYEVDVLCHEVTKDSDGRTLVREQKLLSEHKYPLIFLKMISDTQGFVLVHEPVVEKEATGLTIRCHHFYKEDSNSWALSYLFSYTIPLSAVLPESSERLCEGFLPFVPWYDSGTFYFINSKGSGLAIFSYAMSTRETQLLVDATPGSFYCAPMTVKTLIGSYLIHGGNIINNMNQPFDSLSLIKIPTV